MNLVSFAIPAKRQRILFKMFKATLFSFLIFSIVFIHQCSSRPEFDLTSLVNKISEVSNDLISSKLDPYSDQIIKGLSKAKQFLDNGQNEAINRMRESVADEYTINLKKSDINDFL